MKQPKIFYIALIFATLISVSCKKPFFYDGINSDPTKVTINQLNESPNVLLNGAIETVGYTIGGDVSRYTSTMLQSVRGAARQFSGYDSYIYSAQDFDNVWLNLYTGALNNLSVLKDISDKKGYNYYAGISRVLMAYSFGIATDMWGDVPVFSALKGGSGLTQPKYDPQSKIYEFLQLSLDSAITMLAKPAGAIAPGSDDFIFGGNAGKWTKFAYALKARYYSHLSNTDAGWASKALNAIDKAFSSNSDNAQVHFFSSETSSNPWYQYYRDRGDIYVSNDPDLPSNVATMLVGLNDPRVDKFINLSDGVVGPYLASMNSGVMLMSYSELLFIKSEALSTTNSSDAAAAYNSAVTASFDETGATLPTDYLATNNLSGTTHATRLPQIIKQKYLALFTSPEAFNDYRRTGYPVIAPTTGSRMPARFLYPQNELDNNKANVPTGTTLFSKVGWAK